MDEVKADALFRDKVRAVSDDWSVSLEAARSHNDVSKIRAGQTKLVTVELVMKKYDRLAKRNFGFLDVCAIIKIVRMKIYGRRIDV